MCLKLENYFVKEIILLTSSWTKADVIWWQTGHDWLDDWNICDFFVTDKT